MPAPAFTFLVTCRRPLPGRVDEVRALQRAGAWAEADSLCRTAWSAEHHNVVTVAGRNAVGETMFNGAPPAPAWYVGLAGLGAKDANDTAALHPGWVEVVAYDSPTRAALHLGTFVTGVADNIASPAVFLMNAAYAVSGIFVISDGAKAGTGGVLYNMADWLDGFGAPAPRSGNNGDTITGQAQVGM